MNIIFHPCYDTRCCLDPKIRGGVMLDTLVAGPLALLQELELRLGLTAAPTPQMSRTIEYMTLLRRYCNDNRDSLFARSFEADEYNVAAELLRWRDMLRLAGWNSSMRGISDRIDLLADIEAQFPHPALGDRWQAVAEALPDHDMSEWRIDVRCPGELLFPLYGRILDLMSASGAEVSFTEQRSELPAAIHRITTRSLNEAMEMASALDTANRLVICSHGKQFNNTLRLNGLPTTESSIAEGNTAVVQLFESGFSLFIHPSAEQPEAVNIYTLLSYLQAQPNPLPARVRYALQRLIIADAGINPESWSAAIDGALAATDDPDRSRKAIDTMLMPHFGAITPQAIPTATLKEYARSLRSWAAQRSHLSQDSNAAALPMLVQMCDAMLALLEAYPEATIEGRLLQNWISSIHPDMTIRNTEAQVGSFAVVDHPAAAVDTVASAVWVDCFGVPQPRHDYEFLTAVERRRLEDRGVKVRSRAEEIKAELKLIRLGLGQIRDELIVITPASYHGEPLEAHPIIEEMKSCMDDTGKHSPQPTVGRQIYSVAAARPDVCTKRSEFRIAPDMITPRAEESYSSLDLLIQQPFNYVMQYAARLRPASLQELDALERIEGIVAHRTLELIVREAHNDRTAIIRTITDTEAYNRHFMEAVHQCGMALLLQRNTLQRMNLQMRLHNSLSTLMQALISAGLSIEGLEVEASRQLLDTAEPRLSSRVDMLLRNAAGDPVILDLKWSRSRNRYEDLLRQGRDMQLRLYDWVISGSSSKTVAATGYYLLAIGHLISAQLPDTANYIKHIDSPATTADAVARVQASYRLRYGQLQRGVIEEGEGMETANLPYHTDGVPAEILWPLNTESDKGITKRTDPYNKAFNIFKGTLK